MNEEMKKLSEREIKIYGSLDIIKECVEVARGYINNEYEVNDVDELVVALNCVKEYIKDIKEAVLELEQENEVLRYEQL